MKLSPSNRKNCTAIILLLTVLAGLFSPLQRVFAEPQSGGIEVKAEAGFQNYVKAGKWYPVKLTLTNKTGKDVKGELVVSALSSSTGATIDYVAPAELPQNTEVVVTLGIPGDVLTKSNSLISFYSGSYSNGTKLPVTGQTYIENKVTSSYAIGVISRNPDTLNFMPSLNQRGYDIVVVPLAEEQLPQDSVLLDTLDTIVINDTATSSWSEGQIKAVTDWVKRGGTLVLSGGAGYAKTAEAFQQIAPVKATGTAELSELSILAVAGEAGLPDNAKMTVSTGEIIEGSPSLLQDGVPLAVTRSVGLGQVIYAAFDPSLAPIASWSGSATLWAKLLQDNLQMNMNGGRYGGSLFQTLNYTIDQFPSITPPKFGLLMLIFAIYLFLVAPLLYIVLSKADRREWAWWLIPSLSVIASLSVLLFGAGDKRSMSAHTIEVVELAGDGDGIKSGATGVFVPTGGTVRIDFGEKVYATSYTNNSTFGDFSPNGSSQIIMNDDSSSAVWRDVSYWSTRKAWLDERVIEGEAGQFALSFNNENGTYKATVTNQTASDLTDVGILIGGQAYHLGDLKMGESASAALTTIGNRPYGYTNYGWMLFSQSSNTGQDNYYRHRELLDAYMNQNSYSFAGDYPAIVGFNVDKSSKYKVNGSDIKSNNLTMYVQRIGEMDMEGNKLFVTSSTLTPSVIDNSLQHLNFQGSGMLYVGTGELVLQYALPRANEVVYTELLAVNAGYSSNQYARWMIWNETNGDWEDMPAGPVDPKDYTTGESAIRMKLIASNDIETMLPVLTLEGEVK